jgi:hypothetical protein
VPPAAKTLFEKMVLDSQKLLFRKKKFSAFRRLFPPEEHLLIPFKLALRGRRPHPIGFVHGI